MIDPTAQMVVAAELEAGERLLWAARPNAGRAFAKNWFFLPFGGCFSAFALFWIAGASLATFAGRAAFNAPFILNLFPLFGVPFVLVGLFLMAQPFLARRKAQNGACAITDRRAMIVEGASSNFAFGARRVRSFGPRDFSGIERRDLNDGSSDVIFARERINNRNGSSWSEIGFFGVPEGREAERMLRSLTNPQSPTPRNSGAVDWTP